LKNKTKLYFNATMCLLTKKLCLEMRNNKKTTNDELMALRRSIENVWQSHLHLRSEFLKIPIKLISYKYSSYSFRYGAVEFFRNPSEL